MITIFTLAITAEVPLSKTPAHLCQTGDWCYWSAASLDVKLVFAYHIPLTTAHIYICIFKLQYFLLNNLKCDFTDFQHAEWC